MPLAHYHPERYVRRLLLWAALSGLPAVVLTLGWLWFEREFPELVPASDVARWTVTLAVLGLWLGAILVLRDRLVRPLQTLSNVLMGLREGDYSFAARGASPADALGAVMVEVNALVELMRQQRLGALEATALLRTVMGEIDVAVFAFDGDHRLRLVNRAGERLLTQPVERLLGRTAAELGLVDSLEGEAPRTVQMSFPGAVGRWAVHRQQFRQGGMPLTLLVLSDLSRELREEERQAWQRLVRVLGHELNNSLAPVKSIAGSLEQLVQREPLPPDWKQDMRDGLGVIAGRAESLSRFVGAYAQLARLPKPRPQPVEVASLVTRAASLETRVAIEVRPGPGTRLLADPDQLEQVLINLLRNAADAVIEIAPHEPPAPARSTRAAAAARAEAQRGVRVGWTESANHLEIWVEDDGPGLANTANLFVPFFTTKPRGSGIGLVLSRQIVEGHRGSLSLENRQSGGGCVARLRLPLKLGA
jgi:nitrogen fixation/metabolism regulation signal transduction histidine kinase